MSDFRLWLRTLHFKIVFVHWSSWGKRLSVSDKMCHEICNKVKELIESSSIVFIRELFIRFIVLFSIVLFLAVLLFIIMWYLIWNRRLIYAFIFAKYDVMLSLDKPVSLMHIEVVRHLSTQNVYPPCYFTNQPWNLSAMAMIWHSNHKETRK